MVGETVGMKVFDWFWLLRLGRCRRSYGFVSGTIFISALGTMFLEFRIGLEFETYLYGRN